MSPPEDNASQADLSMAVSVFSSGVFGLVRSDKGDGLPVDFATFFKALAASPQGVFPADEAASVATLVPTHDATVLLDCLVDSSCGDAIELILSGEVYQGQDPTLILSFGFGMELKTCLTA